jgi:hypothetical protein
MENKISKLYRVVLVWRDYASFHFCFDEYTVFKHTPCGCWIIMPSGQKSKWVSAKSKKRYAYPTKTEAMEGYKHKKISQISILEEQLENAKNYLKEAEEYLERENKEIK